METINSDVVHNDLETFVITNGRSTFNYVIRSLESQSVKRKITVIRDMKWVDALNKCVELCQCNYFLRVDDDMALHRYAVEYYISRMRKMIRAGGGVYVCRLWEDWSSKPVNGLRMYSHEVSRRIGFQASELGKVDKVFRSKMLKIKKIQVKDKSVVGLHMLAHTSDQEKYRNLWRDCNAVISRTAFSKTFDNQIHKFSKSYKKQYAMLKMIRRLNKEHGSVRYLRFIAQKREEGA